MKQLQSLEGSLPAVAPPQLMLQYNCSFVTRHNYYSIITPLLLLVTNVEQLTVTAMSWFRVHGAHQPHSTAVHCFFNSVVRNLFFLMHSCWFHESSIVLSLTSSSWFIYWKKKRIQRTNANANVDVLTLEIKRAVYPKLMAGPNPKELPCIYIAFCTNIVSASRNPCKIPCEQLVCTLSRLISCPYIGEGFPNIPRRWRIV